MFADDIVLLAESKEGLQTCLNKLEGYAKDWKMTVNKKKTKVMIIQNRGKMPAIDITYEGQRLEVVDNYKYLGTIDLYTNKSKRGSSCTEQCRLVTTGWVSKRKNMKTRQSLCCYVIYIKAY